MKKYCQKCNHELESWSIGWKCNNCGCFEDMNGIVHENKEEPFMPPMTNADKIRSMTDEELSQFLCNGIENVFCDLCTKCSCRYAHCKDELCKTNLIEWLKQTVKGE